MYQHLKKKIYFIVAWYFRFFAQIRLRKWNPRVIVVTGSNGKTSLMHLIESQLTKGVKFSHRANSSFGIPFNILGIERKKLTNDEWPLIFLQAPLAILKKVPIEKIYVVEVDCDRPYEGKFLSSLLYPEVTLWLNSARTHSENFEHLVTKDNFIEDVIAHEYGYLVEKTTKLVIVNADSKPILKQLTRVKAETRKTYYLQELKSYQVSKDGTKFKFADAEYKFPNLLPQEFGASILLCKELLKYLNSNMDVSFAKFQMPPGRSSLFKGKNGLTLIDSTYNANLESMKAVLGLYKTIPGNRRWAILGDMLEQGEFTKEEHIKLADVIMQSRLDRVVLMGSRITQYTYPIVKKKTPQLKPVKFFGPDQVLVYLKNELKPNDTVLFKGARFLDGVLEHFLADKKDASKLARREKIWNKRRKKWGL